MSENLKCYAVSKAVSKGRRFAQKSHALRADFERDRDRVIHSEAFRRLEGKTQVFAAGQGDHYRNRLTHSIEVSQIGRTIAKNLGLNESLTEAICLAHDLGHSPFGHLGEEILDRLMTGFGGFEHNNQSLRIVDLLEHPYADFAGLNLMYETRLGLAKHKSKYDHPENDDFKEANCSLEGQVADMADRIAYNCHDLEDGMRAGLLTIEQLKDIEIFKQAEDLIWQQTVCHSNSTKIRTAKTVIDILVSDCIFSSKETIAAAQLKGVEDVYDLKKNLITLSAAIDEKLCQLEKFLYDNFYMHDSVTQMQGKVLTVLTELFEKFKAKPELMPVYYQKLKETQGCERVVCDYIAGMTDRFCLKAAEKI